MTNISPREILFVALSQDAELKALVPGGFFEIGSMLNTKEPHKGKRPFGIIRLSFTQSRVRPLGKVSYGAVWIHDQPGTYKRIDEALERVRHVLQGLDHHDNFLECRWIEDSIDFRDDDQGTIVRYARFQIIYTTREG